VLLEYVQQFGLKLHGQFRDLVDKDGSTPRRRQQSLSGCAGARECAPYLAEQFAFDQCGCQRATVNGDEGTLRLLGKVVNGARHQSFARTTLTINQYWVTFWRDFLDQVVNPLHFN